MAEAQSKLPSFEGENREKYDGPDTSKYTVYKLIDLDEGDIYHANAVYLSDIYEVGYILLFPGKGYDNDKVDV